MEGQVVLALCGFGRAGQFHFKGIRLNNRCRLKYVVEVEVEKAEKIILSSNISNVVVINGKDFHVALADPEVQAVIVATPTFTHEGYVTQALQAGKAVLCEKPIAEDIEKVAFCYSEAERAGKPLICAFNRRFDPSMARIQTKVANGDIGKVHILKTTSRDYPPPTLDYLKISGGMFHDTGIHDLDMVCWMIGEEPTTVHTMAHAHQQAVGDIPDVDTLVITMKFPSGVIAIIDISRHSTYGYDQRIEVYDLVNEEVVFIMYLRFICSLPIHQSC